MFTPRRATSADVGHAIKQQSRLHMDLTLLDPLQGLQVSELPKRFVRDVSRSKIGTGRNAFESGIRAFEKWKQFDLGWVRVVNQEAVIRIGQIVAVEVRALGLWSLNLSQIVSVTKTPEAFGFIYKTTPHHAEEGEERFLLTIDPSTNAVHYELEAVSKPHHWLPQVGYPITRSFQHRFARDSHKRVREAVSESPG